MRAGALSRNFQMSIYHGKLLPSATRFWWKIATPQLLPKVNCCMYTSTTIPRNKSGEIVLLFRRHKHYTYVRREDGKRDLKTTITGTAMKRLSNSSLWNRTQTCSVIISCAFVIPFFRLLHTHTHVYASTETGYNQRRAHRKSWFETLQNEITPTRQFIHGCCWLRASKRSFVLFRDNCLKASSLFLFVIEISTEKPIFALRSLNFARCRSKTTPTTYLCHNDVSRRHMKF